MKTINLLLSVLFFSATLVSTSAMASKQGDRSQSRSHSAGQSQPYSQKAHSNRRYNRQAIRHRGYSGRHASPRVRHGGYYRSYGYRHQRPSHVTIIQQDRHYSGGHGYYSGVPIVAGAIVGGVIGNNIGHGDPGAAAAGAFMGAIIGGSLGQNRHHGIH
jgi:Glycine zipper 2TM domain